MKDHSVLKEIQEFHKTGNRSEVLSEIQCSALAYLLQTSEEVLDELNPEMYKTPLEGNIRLILVVRNWGNAM